MWWKLRMDEWYNGKGRLVSRADLPLGTEGTGPRTHSNFGGP